jgi:glycosyltransferase involved in cell wall biosynthesis
MGDQGMLPIESVVSASTSEPKLSVAIVACNEADVLGECLESVRWADEIVVVDLESSDDTVEVARRYNATIFQHRHVDFVELVRNFSIEKTTGQWILVLDPDERITPDLAEAIRLAIRDTSDLVALELPRVSYFFGREIRHAGYGVDYIARVFRRGAVEWRPEVHFRPKLVGKVEAIPYTPERKVIHLNYTSIRQFIEKMNRYTDNEAQLMLASGRSFRWYKPFSYSLRELLNRYFALRGYKDGMHGLIISVLFAIYWAVIALKMWDIARDRKQT